MKVLCLGYSVTELGGYVDFCMRYFSSTERSFEIARSGWGGHTIDTIAYCIEEILSNDNYDAILLEIFTSHIRTLGERKIRFYLDAILTVLAKEKIPIAFLQLFDGSIDYNDDFLSKIVREYSSRYEVPLLDLAQIVAQMDGETRAKYFWDNVHNTPEGIELYGNRIVSFIETGLFSSIYANAFRARKYSLRSLRLEAGTLTLPYYVLTRNGSPCKFYEIKEGASIDIPLPSPVHVTGVMLAYAPDSGPIDITSAYDNWTKRLVPHDVWSYYIRSGFFELDIPSTRSITLYQTNIIPETQPLRGEKNTSSRIGRISHIFYIEEAGPGFLAVLLKILRSIIFMPKLN